jgi:uncharacterized protein (TIGR01319 family)
VILPDTQGDPPGTVVTPRAYLLADFGSTFTKLAAVEAISGRLLARADHRTTVDSDVMIGYRSALEELALASDVEGNIEMLACSSAGGGLRVVVVGLERDITTEAARRVALNSGGRIVATVSADLDEDEVLATLRASAADIALIVGGTDGGNASALVERARAVAATLPRTLAVVAGNVESSRMAAAVLEEAGIETEVVANVLPEIGTLVAAPARDAIRTVFIRHVIGGKHLSSEADFIGMVHMPTPDAVLGAVELLAEIVGDVAWSRPVIVVDVGGATTDVYSAMGASTPSSDHGFVPVPTLPTRRTVEADLGLRWSAPGVVDAARELGMLTEHEEARLRPAADQRAREPWLLPTDDQAREIDAELAALSIAVALVRHAGTQQLMLERDGMGMKREGPDLRGDAFIVLTGGIFRAQGGSFDVSRTAEALRAFDRRRHLLPTSFDVVVDRDYVLAACGLLATRDRDAAKKLLCAALPALFEVGGTSHD